MAWRLLLAAALSAVALFVWGFVFWGPVLNMTARLLTPLPDATELDVLAPLRAGQIPSGMYVYPGPLSDQSAAATEAWEKKATAGPIIHMAYSSGGTSPMDPVMFAKGLAHGFVLALLMGLMLVVVLPGLPSYGRRATLLVLASLVAALWTNVGNVIWWFHPPSYAGGQVVYTFVGGVLMALITAAIVKPATPAPANRARD